MTTPLDHWLTRSLYLSVGFNAMGTLAIALPQVFYPILGIPVPEHPVYQAVAVLTIALFGLGYLLQARTEQRDRTFLLVAALGKIGFFAIFLVSWLVGLVPWTAPLVTSGDLVFALVFMAWLWATRAG
ncbi:MAG: hypothetical protein EI684_08190 [Candidatus Viridilinea halotolerans]|uniref:Uncharacterized protein n=1 Tax=Candidatus Viridilinea halotolerans TaxID=2491704 RepID=A0A426U2H4_9CHLR|nr:MAG: hypothetical protein EI684_08190 [Candidatus Viridilinea halotolerans]